MAEHHSQRELGPDAGGLNGNTNTGKIRASHLLVKHKDSRRPSSWREVG
jgi:NIMA-interacting peptidyl-prolyl cis-trans isomerase 1